MNGSPELQAKIRASLLKIYGPSIEGAELVDNIDEPSSSYIREQLRTRGLSHVNGEIEKKAPREKRLVYRLSKGSKETGISITQTIVVIADNSGNILDVIESG